MKSKIATAILVPVLLSSCATVGQSGVPLPKNPRPTNTPEEKTAARQDAVKAGIKGCGIGVAMGALTGLLTHRINPAQMMAGCVAGGVTSGIQAYRDELNAFRALKTSVHVGALVDVYTTETTVQGQKTEAVSDMVVHLDAAKVRAGSPDIKAVLSTLATTLNRQQRPTTVTITGSGYDRYGLNDTLRPLITSKMVTVQVGGHGEGGDYDKPVITVNPAPAQ